MKYSLLAALIAQAIVSFSCATVQSSPSCKDENGNDVDWFIIYKLPYNKLKSFNPTGGKFAYIDSENSKNGLQYWPISKQDLFKNKNPVAYTLEPLYKKTTRKDILYFVYNDEPPQAYEGKGEGQGHSKGVVLFDNTAGLWLLHSVPTFMEGLKSGGYKLPDRAKNNGQMFMCITFKTEQVETIATLLRTQNAKVYDHQLPKWIPEEKNSYPEVKLLARNVFVEEPKTLKVNLARKDGHILRAYAKSASAGEDLYADELFRDLNEPIAVQSWMNGRGGKYLSASDVSHINTMEWEFKKDNAIEFPTTVDHSKWAFTVNKDTFCFASTNRKPSQEKRGGEALCFVNRAVKDLFCRGVKEASSEAIVTCQADRKRPRSESKRRKA
ncbi:hypothetical protein MTO96_017531 [Rhipicephalus appendiculatus]